MHQQSNYAIGNPLNKTLSANTFLRFTIHMEVSYHRKHSGKLFDLPWIHEDCSNEHAECLLELF